MKRKAHLMSKQHPWTGEPGWTVVVVYMTEEYDGFLQKLLKNGWLPWLLLGNDYEGNLCSVVLYRQIVKPKVDSVCTK